jgi:hypothetical protein
MKRKRDNASLPSNDSVQQSLISCSQNQPFWNEGYKKISEGLTFVRKIKPRTIEERSWYGESKKYARRGWFDCKMYERNKKEEKLQRRGRK